MKTVKLTLIGIGTLLTVGCAGSAVEADFGESVRNMVQAQQAHPEVSRNPDPEAVDSTDGGRVVNAVDAYRSDVSKPSEVSQDIILRIGGGGRQ